MPDDTVPAYAINILNISRATEVILTKIRDEFVSKVNISGDDLGEENTIETIRQKFSGEILALLNKYLPKLDKTTSELLINYLITQNIGLGNVEILLRDPNLEEITINTATEPVWVYHRKYGWLKTNVRIPSEARIRHYATIIGRDIGKEITLLRPLMDAHLRTGDRVNATLSPISTKGNTITIRKFAERPWSITDFINSNTISVDAAAWVWLAIQHELSLLISGGTGSGKTSALNTIANFFPPNQRIISIEDTRELTLPNTLHWVPMETRLPNPEGKGEVTMLDLVVNALRMRPDRIIVGEIRRKAEAEVLFEAMHTGHSVYATLHANSVQETIIRLTNPPIDIPKPIIESVSLILSQYRNRRTGLRRTLQLAEILQNGDPRVLLQLDVAHDQLVTVNQPTRTLETLQLYTGLTVEDIRKDLSQKARILRWMVKQNITDVHQIGMLMAKYYAGKLLVDDVIKA
ncbi:MAG: ATPase, T2SS/T4P/T4SS family [Nanoarchaeota archaeon]